MREYLLRLAAPRVGKETLLVVDRTDVIKQWLADLAGRSKSFYTIKAIREHLEDLEDFYLAERRLIALRSRQSRTVPLEEVMPRYGLDD